MAIEFGTFPAMRVAPAVGRVELRRCATRRTCRTAWLLIGGRHTTDVAYAGLLTVFCDDRSR